MYGLNEKHINEIKSIFDQDANIEKAIIYGSRAIGNYRDNSDIDLTLVGNELNLNSILKIENLLDDLLLPYNIDISIFNKIENKDLVDHIKRVGIIFYEKKDLTTLD